MDAPGLPGSQSTGEPDRRSLWRLPRPLVCRSAPHRPAAILPRAAGPVCVPDFAGLLPGLPHMPNRGRFTFVYLYAAMNKAK